MTRGRLALVASCVLLAAASHAAVGDWTSYTRLVVRRIAATGTDVWAATAGGIIHSNLRNETVRTYSPTEGLSDGDIHSVLLDSLGTVWFGSEAGGLIRFAVRAGTGSPVLLEPLLRGEVSGIMALATDGSRLYVGHHTGLTVLDLATNRVIETYHQLGPTSDIRNQQVTAAAVVGTRIVAGLTSGLAIGDLGTDLLLPGNWQYLAGTFFASPFDTVDAVAAFNGVAYIATRAGIFRETASGWQTVGPALPAHDLAAYDGAIWAATDGGVYLSTDGQSWSRVTAVSGPARALASVPGTMLVAAGSGGTYRVVGAASPVVTKVPGVDIPPGETFRCLAVDTSGALWVAPGPVSSPGEDVSGLGIFRFKDNRWTQFRSGQDGLLLPFDRSGFVSIAVDGQNRVWAGSWGAGLSIIDQSSDPPRIETATSYNSPLIGLANAPAFVVVRAFAPDPGGAMWAAVYHSLLFALPPGYHVGDPRVTDVAAPFISRGDVPATLAPTSLARDHAGVLWIGTNAGVVLLYPNGTPTDPSDDRFVGMIGAQGDGVSLLSQNVKSIAVDRTGDVWVGTDAGLTSFSGQYDRTANSYSLHATHYTRNGGLPSDIVQAVMVDSANVKWIGTDRGLAQITPGGPVVDLTSSRLVDPDGNVAALAYDAKRGYVWIGTPHGLNRYEAYLPAGARDTLVAEPSSNPYRIELARRGPDYVLTGPPLTVLVTPGATFRIYTVTGDLVFEATDAGIGQVTWDGRTRGGSTVVASGVYLYVAERGDRRAMGKIAVIRDAR